MGACSCNDVAELEMSLRPPGTLGSVACQGGLQAVHVMHLAILPHNLTLKLPPPLTGGAGTGRAFSAAQVPSGWYASTDSEPSEDAAASSSPSSCGANATPFTDALCTGAEYTCPHGQTLFLLWDEPQDNQHTALVQIKDLAAN